MAPAALVMGALLAAAVALTRVDAVWHSDAVMVNGQSVTCPCDTAPCRLWTAAEVVGGGAGVALSQPMCSVNAATCVAGRGAVVAAADWLVGLVTKRVSLARCTAPITWVSPWSDVYAMTTDGVPNALDMAWRQTAVPVGINSRDARAGVTLRLHCVRCGGAYGTIVNNYGVYTFRAGAETTARVTLMVIGHYTADYDDFDQNQNQN